MDKISILPDDVLVKILSLVPTKVAVSTSILSKRWEFLWMWLPRLEYISKRDTGPLLRDFIDKNMPLHRAPVIECLRFCLQLGRLHIKPEDIRQWVEISVSRHVRELEVDYYLVDYYSGNQNILPSSLFTCKSLVTLKLSGVICVDVPSMVCLPSLKTLLLRYVTFIDGKSLQHILSVCPVLEDLSMHFHSGNLKEFTIIVPSLQSLSLRITNDWILDGYEIDTHSLKYLKLEEWNLPKHYYSLIKNMPKLREAYVDVGYANLNSVIGSITSVKRLTICCLEDLYGDGCVFKELEHLNLCVCNKDSSNHLGRLLKGSPSLRVLDISVMKDHEEDNECNDTVCWNQPTSVPECLLSSLQIFKWSQYFGRRQDRDIAVYILKNACHLKKATILTDTRFVPKLEMIKELTLSPPASSTCQLVFAEN